MATTAMCLYAEMCISALEQFASAVRLEAAWMLTLLGCLEVASHHNSVALHSTDFSNRTLLRQCVQASFPCQQSSSSQWGEYQTVALDA